MPPKGGKGKQSDRNRGPEEEIEEPLQAVILADSFETRFSPFTLERPRCLLPLANTPLIEYTFEFLANAGVEEVYVYSGAHTDQVEAYIEQSRWSSKVSPFAHLEILRSTSGSIGDAMRDLDKRAILSGDFLVVYGDVVSNLPLEGAIAAHRERRLKDKNSIMTMVLREAGTQHRTKAQGLLPVFVVEPSKQRCLQYEQLRAGHGSRLNLDPDILQTTDEFEVRQDLIDCGIDICTPDVLALWSDNFDYEAPRKGFLHSVLKDYELNGKKIHTHIVDQGYGARVRDLRAYDVLSKDVVSRWAYPLCLDTNLVRDQTYRRQKGNLYTEEGVVLTRSCVLGSRTAVGRATAVGDGSVIKDSVIGRRCIIGRNVSIEGSYVWDDATIGDGTVVRGAIVANEASIGKRCKVLPGALVSYGVRIADGITVAATARITRMKQNDGDDSEPTQRGEDDFQVVGKGGEGFQHEDSEDEDDSDAGSGLAPTSLYSASNLSQESISTLQSEDLSEDDHVGQRHSSRSASFGSIASDDSGGLTKHAVDFHHDAAASIFDSLQKGDEPDNINLELTALRMSADASPHQVRRAVIAAFMKRIATLIESGSTTKQAVEQTIPPQKMLLKRTVFDYGEDVIDKPDQVDFLVLMQSDLCHRKDGPAIMLTGGNELVMRDIIETEGFEQWHEDERSHEGKEMMRIREAMKPFMDAIVGSDEESDDEDDDDEDEDDV